METTRPGLVLVGLERRFVYVDLLTGILEETGIEVTTNERVIINEGLAVEGGALFGTEDLEFRDPLAAVYFLDAAIGELRTVVPNQICSNGKILRRTPKGATLFDIDSHPKTITRYELDSQFQVLE